MHCFLCYPRFLNKKANALYSTHIMCSCFCQSLSIAKKKKNLRLWWRTIGCKQTEGKGPWSSHSSEDPVKASWCERCVRGRRERVGATPHANASIIPQLPITVPSHLRTVMMRTVSGKTGNEDGRWRCRHLGTRRMARWSDKASGGELLRTDGATPTGRGGGGS